MANKIDENDEKLKVFVSKLAYQTDEDSLKAHFEASFGPVSDVCIKRDEGGNSKGFGFVLFQEEAAAALAIHNTQHHQLQGRTFQVKKVTVKEQIRKVFVGGVSPKISEDELREYFGQYGEIENLEVSYDKNTNVRRSFVFVVYKTGAAVNAAAAKPKQEISGFYVDVKKAVPMDQHQQGKGFHAYGYETLAARKSMLEAGVVPHPNPRGAPGGRPPRGGRGAPRGGRGRGRGGAAYYDPYAAADPYASGYADPYAADPYAADPYAADPYAADPYAADPYAADPYAADYSEDYSQDYAEDYAEDYSSSGYYPSAPAAGGGKMRGRGGPRGGAPRGGAPRGRGAPRGGSPFGGERGGGRGRGRGGEANGRGGGRGGPRGAPRGGPGGPRGAPRGRARAAPY